MRVKCRGFEGELESICTEEAMTDDGQEYTLSIMVNDTDFVNLRNVHDEEIEFFKEKSEEKLAIEAVKDFLEQIKKTRWKLNDRKFVAEFDSPIFDAELGVEFRNRLILLMHKCGFKNVDSSATWGREVHFSVNGDIPEGFKL